MNNDLLDVLNNTAFITVSTVNEDGSPYATPIGWFAFDGKNIVFDNHSGKNHSNNLRLDNRCFITIVNTAQKHSRAVYIQTIATNLEGAEYQKAKKLIEDKGLKVSDDIAIAPIGEIDLEKSQIYELPNKKRFYCYMKQK